MSTIEIEGFLSEETDQQAGAIRSLTRDWSYSDMRIKPDLDDGVKVIYVKLGELLEPIKGLKHEPAD